MNFRIKRILTSGAFMLAICSANSSSAETYRDYTPAQAVYVEEQPVYDSPRVIYRPVYVDRDQYGIEKAGKSSVGLADRSTKAALGVGGKAMKETLKAVF